MTSESASGRFVFGIRRIDFSNGKNSWSVQTANNNIPAEIILMKMKAWLNMTEKDYFDDFSNNTVRGKS